MCCFSSKTETAVRIAIRLILKLGTHQGTSRRDLSQGFIPECVHTKKLTDL